MKTLKEQHELTIEEFEHAISQSSNRHFDYVIEDGELIMRTHDGHYIESLFCLLANLTANQLIDLIDAFNSAYGWGLIEGLTV